MPDPIYCAELVCVMWLTAAALTNLYIIVSSNSSLLPYTSVVWHATNTAASSISPRKHTCQAGGFILVVSKMTQQKAHEVNLVLLFVFEAIFPLQYLFENQNCILKIQEHSEYTVCLWINIICS